MREIIEKVYKFSELSEEAKQKAIENFRKGYPDYDWWNGVYDHWKKKLEKLGYTDIDIRFSGFWSQGDGASFTGKIDIPAWLKAHPNKNHDRILLLIEKELVDVDNAVIKRDRWGNYVHWNTTSVYVNFNVYGGSATHLENVHNVLNPIESEIQEEVQDLSKEIYSDLEKGYEGVTSDESIAETIEANEYEFYENGERY